MKPLYVAVLSTAMAFAAPVVAQGEPGTANAAAESSAREHFERGRRLTAEGDHASAYREFAAGYALTERPVFLFHMAEAARLGGELAKARASYDAFLRADPNNGLAAIAQERLAGLDAPATPADSMPPTPPPPPSVAEPRPIPPPWVISEPPAKPLPPRRMPSAIAPAPALDEHVPAWKRWPFWTLVGGAVVGSIVIYAAVHDSGPCGGCSELDFR